MRSLERQITFYLSYHSNRVNQLIHIVFVPVILGSFWTLIRSHDVPLPSALCPHLPPFESVFRPNCRIGASTLYAFLLTVLYPSLDLVAGSLCIPLIWILHYVSTFWLPNLFPENVVFQVALLLHVAGWIAQFAGHYIWEKRAPALFDSLLQAIFIAPFFVWLECLFFFGYKKDLQSKVKGNAAKDIAAFRKLREKSA
jgi:uncharacterized membrane protein YGL010W